MNESHNSVFYFYHIPPQMKNFSAVGKEYKPETRSEFIKNMVRCPPSTPSRIVFVPKTDGIGFRCTYGSKRKINPDEMMLSRYSEEL